MPGGRQRNKIAAEIPEAEGVQGQARDVRVDARGRARAGKPAVEGVLAHVRLRQHDVGHRHARQQIPGMQQEMVQLGAVLGAEAAFIEPEILKSRSGDDRAVSSRAEPQAQALQAVSRRHPAPRRTHADRRGRAPACELRRHREHAIDDLRNLLRRGFSLSKRDAERRQERPARQLRATACIARFPTATIARRSCRSSSARSASSAARSGRR